MKEVGTPGTLSGLMMRLGQCGFAAGSVAYMVTATGFSNFTAFCYLIAAMGLQLLWSLGLACLDIYALTIKKDLLNPVLLPNSVLVSLLTLFAVGDWVTATLSLAAACSSAGVIILYGKDFNFCDTNTVNLGCDRFKMSIALAFTSWGLVAMTSHVMFWILAST